jgi:hypothetical protein
VQARRHNGAQDEELEQALEGVGLSSTVAWIKYWQKCNTANVNKEWTHSV